ncbi:hypothetical protein CRYUN_Cryun10bG0124600 [Craigia yunnanensis]
MLRDFKFLRLNSSKNEEVENVPVNTIDSPASQPSNDGSSRAPLNTIQDPMTDPKPEAEGSIRGRMDKTPTKPKAKLSDSTLPLKTPDKHGFLSKNRFGRAKNEAAESDLRNGGMMNMTPRVSRGIGRHNSSCYSESNSTQSTPTKSVSKPPASGFRNKFDGNGGMRGGNFAALYKGVPSPSCGPPTVVNTVEVPHFDLKEDPSFWMDHNVQVLIRVRPLNGMEKSIHGYNRCLKQESSQSIAWIGLPETRFTFDHAACETVDQEMLFRMAGLPMVENCLSGYNSCMFAYGQTGSGKTYTMLGEIEDLEVKPSPQRGMTPRIFEFLFARILAEEEIRKDEKLKYNCKCSFLEIYNEQITDLLDPSATNLLLREDVKKGVYVENLSEFEVQTVSDILKLLTQGSLSRKVAATNMNRESSRSHSVFTCVIERRWEKDSTTNLRFARLNLVDLAGSERQKTSGAEGDRLKEAASINKSLSMLGNVIMILLDVANGKPRHVPYRDSKLTFLLQDSLGGNSKTMIIANVSPSICCATETLNTLKFAQRAKLIQNNAVVNEDSTGDVIALKNQIRLLKEELSTLKRQNVSRSLSFGPVVSGTMQLEENPSDDNSYEMGQEQDDLLGYESKGIVRMSTKQLKSLETTLAGALRREQMAETSIKKLEAETEQLNCLIRQREEDTRSTKMMLRFREDKIQRMESLMCGSLPADSFLFKENKALSEEIQLLQAKVDKNPEVTRFALENIRLLDQLRSFQEFYEEGEKEILLEEISKLRDQLLQFLDGKSKKHSYPSSNDQLQEAVSISKENNSLQLEASNEEETDETCRQAEAETAEVIVCLQEELAILQQQVQDCHLKEMDAQKGATVLETELKELQEKVCMLTEDNKQLLGKLAMKDGELRTLSEEWELLGSEIENILVDGHEELVDATDQLDLISSSFPQRRIWISEQVGRVIRILSEKELLIEELGRCLKDTTEKRSELECMLKSLRGAALVINEAQQRECIEKEKEIVLLKTELNSKTSIMTKLEDRMKMAEDDLINASVCATGAFVLVNRLSEANLSHLNALKDKDIRLAESAEMILSKDAILIDQATMIEEAEKHIHSLKNDVAKSEEACAELEQRLLEEEQGAAVMKQKIEVMEENDILKTQEKLSELRTGVSTLRAHMGMYRDYDEIPERSVRERLYTSDDGSDERRSNIGTDDEDLRSVQELETDISDCSFKVGESLHASPCDEKCVESGKTCKNVCDREVTIILLKKEIESAMECLKEIQAEMGKICNEKEEIRLSEKQSNEGLRCLATHAVALEETMNDFGKLLELKIGAVNHKINAVEQTMQEITTHWCQTKEFFELEVGDAKIIATQKAAEASCILANFEEAQDTITEADIMINGLMIANETMKLDINRQKQVQATLLNERDALINKVQSLQSINIVKDQQLEEQFGSSLTETRYLVVELEGLITELQTAFSQNVMAVACDCHCLKSLLFDSLKLARSWLEDVWSEIIVKNCAVSVLHLCHMGILLETLTGLIAENGLLQHGLSESNAVIADLREHNSKSRRELEMCRVIKGKILADIKNSFDRISKKEEETGELSVKLVTLEKKISDLQFLEEVMLQRSNYMGSQLTVLMEELDLSNTIFVASLLDQEQLLKDSQAEISMVDFCTKEFESLILASEMKQMVVHLADSGKKLRNAFAVLDGLKKEMIFSKVDACLKEQLLVEWEIESSFLQEKFEEAQSELRKLKKENCLLLQDFEEKRSDLEYSVSCLDASNLELHQLKGKTFSLDTCITSLQTDLELKAVELKELQHSQSIIIEDLDLKSHDWQLSVERINTLREENALLSKKLRSLEKNKLKACNKSSLNAAMRVDSVETIEMTGSRLFGILNKGVAIAENMFQELHDNAERISKFIEEFEFLEHRAEELEFENVTLQVELSRKDEVLKGLLFDLSLLPESTSNTKDQKDEIEEVVSSLEALEDELAVKSSELSEAVSHSQMLEVQLQEKLDMISNLQLDISNERESLNLLCSENQELKAHIEDALAVRSSLGDELRERKKITESLEVELSEMNNVLSQMNDTTESLSSNLNELAGERDQLHMEVLRLEEKLGKVQAKAKQSEAIAMKLNWKTYAEDKEAEVKLLERSVEELECTINVLENKVNIIKGEAERQQLQREELELELQAVKVQMQNVKNADADMKRCLDEKQKDLQQALDHIQILETDIYDKDKEISQCKTHISELNLHAEAQAMEYKQKFRALEAMAEQVKPEGYSSHAQNHSSNKLEKNVSKPRGSGSPFKCIGLGLAQQIKSEKDEDLTAARLHIEELESLAANRQKEIFALNARLAAAESMTHDVIRDLLGVKLDMTNYVSLLDNQQVQKIAEKARLNSLESQVKEHEVVKLKQQLNEFVEERRGWLEEIDRKQAEFVAAQIALEKLHQRDQLLKTENEMLKMEKVNYKKKVMKLEGEVKKLSGQQNLQQRIHHHAKIKEENNMLKIQNEDLGAKLQRTEIVLSRVREELAYYRASIGKNPHINFDEEQRLNNKLRESDDDRVQLAQKLLGLCTSVLKAAGITKPVSDICPAAAEEALEQLKNKSRIFSERNRLSELMPQTSAVVSSRTDENCHTPKRVSQTPFLSTLDR